MADSFKQSNLALDLPPIIGPPSANQLFEAPKLLQGLGGITCIEQVDGKLALIIDLVAEFLHFGQAPSNQFRSLAIEERIAHRIRVGHESRQTLCHPLGSFGPDILDRTLNGRVSAQQNPE
jgi:hypothetical protein